MEVQGNLHIELLVETPSAIQLEAWTRAWLEGALSCLVPAMVDEFASYGEEARKLGPEPGVSHGVRIGLGSLRNPSSSKSTQRPFSKKAMEWLSKESASGRTVYCFVEELGREGSAVRYPLNAGVWRPDNSADWIQFQLEIPGLDALEIDSALNHVLNLANSVNPGIRYRRIRRRLSLHGT